MFIVDAHLDLAFNASLGRDFSLSAFDQPEDSEGIPTIGFPEMNRSPIGLICGTIFIAPKSEHVPSGYVNVQQAKELALWQLDWYHKQEQSGNLRIVRSSKDLPCKVDRPMPTILLMEGADEISDPAELAQWHSRGLRIVALAWKKTAHAGGTGQPGGLTDLGRATAKEINRLGMIHDISHLAEQAFWELMELNPKKVIASHSNAREIIPTDRHLSVEMIREIVRVGGVIGVNLFDRFLIPPGEYGTRKACLADVVRQFRYFADLLGSVRNIGLGSDMDGGFGYANLPQELRTIADLTKLGEALGGAGFSDEDVAGMMGGNWMRYFGENLG